MGFIDKIKARAKQKKMTIVLPETSDRRTVVAAHKVLEEDLANLILIGNREEILRTAEGLNLNKAQFVDPHKCDKLEVYSQLLADESIIYGLYYGKGRRCRWYGSRSD